MQHQEKYNLTWNTYSDHLRVMMKEMMTSGDFADVTLVSEDMKKFKAHKTVLGTASTILKDLFLAKPDQKITKGFSFPTMPSWTPNH